jgi:hypothetical protein
MKSCILMIVLTLGAALLGTGCTTMSLELYTLNQIRSVTDFRSRATLNCLAAVAADPGSLPSFFLVTAGTTRIVDTGAMTSTTLWERLVQGFASESAGATVSRAPSENWTLIPAADSQQLEALRCACQWVLYGPEQACNSCPGLLASPEKNPSKDPHFGVEDRLKRLPAGWLHVGRKADVPLCACCTGHSGDTWVWVTPEGLEGLADFSLVLLDIATLDVNAGTRPRIVITLKKTTRSTLASGSSPYDDKVETTCVESRVVKPEYVATVEAILFSKDQVDLRTVPWEEYTSPLEGQRTNVSPTGPNTAAAALRSEISAAGSRGPYQGVSPPPSSGSGSGPYPGVSPPPPPGPSPRPSAVSPAPPR